MVETDTVELKNAGGTAFPISREQEGWWEPGMTLRDWFAGRVMTGIMTHLEGPNPAWAAAKAYQYADAMLIERQKERE